jgi:protein transport protein SEC24
MNPFVQWEASGRRWNCNLCGFSNETVNTYFGPLDNTGRRADRYEHPELSSGSVDYVAPAEYMVRPPQPPAFLFLIDVTAGAVQSGMVDVVCGSLREMVDSERFPGGSRCQFGVITFDTSIHFYNLSTPNPQMILVNDFEELFVPMAEEVLVSVVDNKAAILNLLETIPSMFRTTKAAESCLGSAVKVSHLAMKHVGGKLIVCASTIPSVGDLGLTSRKDNVKLLNTDREIELLKSTVDGYRELATELTKVQICCELFIPTNMYVDLASIAPLAALTAGDLRHYQGFSSATHGDKLHSELVACCTRPMGWEAVMRVRVSKGWKISKFYGHLYVRGADLLVVPNCHSDQTYAITIEPVENEQPDPTVCVQFALLYTNSEAERRIRVHTIQLVSSPAIHEVIGSIDPEAAAALVGHVAVEESLKANLSAGRNFIHTVTQSTVACAPGVDGLQNLALYNLGLLKSLLFRATTDVFADQRIAQWSRFASAPLSIQSALMYPRMFPLHSLARDDGEVDESTGRVTLPTQLPCSAEQMTQDGVFLLEDGESMIMWIGTGTTPETLYDLFGVQSVAQLNLEAAEKALGQLSSPRNQKTGRIIAQLRTDRSPTYMNLLVVPHEHPYSGRFFQNLVEDRTVGLQMNYTEFLQRIGLAQPGGGPTATPPLAGGMMPPQLR